MAFFTRFTPEKRPQNNFSCQNFSVENDYFLLFDSSIINGLKWSFLKMVVFGHFWLFSMVESKSDYNPTTTLSSRRSCWAKNHFQNDQKVDYRSEL